MKLHHIGLLVKDIQSEAAHFCKACGYEICSDIIEDKIQTAKVQFLKLPKDESYLELICPNSENSKLANALKKSVRLHHQCFETCDIEKDLAHFRENGFMIICQPTPAAAFNEKKIAWVMDANKNLFELLEENYGNFKKS